MTEVQLRTTQILFPPGCAEPLLRFPGENEIHLWIANLNGFLTRVQQLANSLSPDERARAERFLFDKDRSRFIIRRAILRSLLGGFLGIPGAAVHFSFGTRGKPCLADDLNTGNIHFNISHSNGAAVFAFSTGQEIGVDVEQIRSLEGMDDIAARFFAPHERKTFRAIPRCQKPNAFFNCWTRKEAFIKATGDGLFFPLDRFEVSLVPGEEARLLSIEGSAAEASGWTIHEIESLRGYSSAIAVKGRTSNVVAQLLASQSV